MKGLKQKFKRPVTNGSVSKDASWTHQDQRLWQAVASNQPAKVAAKLSKHPDVDVNRICPNVGYSVLHYAAAKGLDDCLNILLAHKADASSHDVTGATPLHAAARYGHKGTTSKLLASRTVDVNHSDNNQCTALHFAAFEGHDECVKLIADAPNVNLNATDKDGRTPLMVGAAMGKTAVCKALVDRKCDVHHRDDKLGHTALTLAADSGHASVVRLLCESGANHEEALNDGRSALDLAKHKDRRSVVDALHIVQLTEAANRAPGGPRLSTSGNKYKSDDPSKKRHSCDGILDSVHQTYIDDLVAGTHLSSGSRTPKPSRKSKEEKKPGKSNLARVKAAVGAKMKSSSPRRDSDASGLSAASTPRQKSKKDSSPGSNALPLYTEGSANFYEKELKFYDSNSSLDVSSTCSAMNNISKSMDSLRPTPEESDGMPNAFTSVSQSPVPKVERTGFTKERPNSADVKRLERKNEDQQRRIAELEEALRKSKENSITSERLQKSSEEARKSQIAAAKEEYERKEGQMKAEFNEMKQISIEFERQNKDLLKRLTNHQHLSVTLNNMKDQLRKYEMSNSKLREENKLLLEKLDNMESENENLRHEIDNGRKTESTIISQAKEKIMEAESRCNQAEQKLANAEQRCEVLTVRADEFEKKCNHKDQTIQDLDKRCSDLGHIRSNWEEVYTKTERELNESNKQRNDLEEKLADITKEKRKVERELKKLKESHGEDQLKLNSYKSELQEISSLLNNAGHQVRGDYDKSADCLLRVKPDVKSLIEKLKVEEGIVANNDVKSKELEEKLNTSIDEKNRKIEDLQRKIKESEDALHQKAAECSRLDSELTLTKGQLFKLDKEKQKIEEKYESELNKSRTELAKYEAAKLSEASEFSRSKHEVSDLRQQLDEALGAMEKMREESVSREAYEADCARIKKDADLLKKEVTKTLEKFALLQLELVNKEQELSDLRVERNQSEAKSTKFEQEVATLKSKCHESEVQVNVLRQQLTETKQKLNKCLEEVNNLRTSRKDMTARLSAKHNEINDGDRKNVENLKKQVDNLSRHLQESEKRYRETIAIYRGHLLAAVTGQLDGDVQQALQEILKLRGKDDDKSMTSTT